MTITSPTVLLKLYRDCVAQSTKAFLKNWIVLPASIAMYLFLSIVLVPFFGSFGIAGGFFLGLLITCVFTFFYSWIYRTIRKEKLVFKDLTEFDYSLFICIINTGFVLWIVRFFVEAFSAAKGDNTIQLLFNFAVVLLCNPLPEVLYIRRNAGLEALHESFQFTQSFWLEWFLPFLILLSPLLMRGAKATLYMFGLGTELMPTFVVMSLGDMLFPFPVGDILGVTVLVWFTLFRGFLFNELSEGGLRRRSLQSR